VRTDVAERGVTATAIVERLDVFEDVLPCFVSSGVALRMHPLILQTVEEALDRRVVPAIALARHRGEHAVFAQQRLIIVTAVLAAAIRVMHHTV
jgi:hypothetical protein